VVDANETALLQGARDGDLTAFEQLQALLDAPARRFVRRLIGRSDAEDDIVQNAFFALYKNLERLDVGEKLRPFLFRVLRNQCYDQLRRLGRYDVISLDDDSDDVDRTELAVDQRPQPEESAHWLMLYNEVQMAIQRLPELQRQTLLLYTEAGLSYQEIADAMGVSIGTVKSRLHNGKRNLVSMLHPDTLYALDVAAQGEPSDE